MRAARFRVPLWSAVVMLLASVLVLTGVVVVATPAPVPAATVPPITLTAMSPQVTGTTGRLYTTSLTPAFRARGGLSQLEAEVSYDPAYADGAGVVWAGTGTGEVRVDRALQRATHYRYRMRGGSDGLWTDFVAFTTNIVLPSAPRVTCESTGGDVRCALSTSSSDGSGYHWGLDDPSTPQVRENGTNTGRTQSISLPTESGEHTLYVRTRDTAHHRSAAITRVTFTIGNGAVTNVRTVEETTGISYLDPVQEVASLSPVSETASGVWQQALLGTGVGATGVEAGPASPESDTPTSPPARRADDEDSWTPVGAGRSAARPGAWSGPGDLSPDTVVRIRLTGRLIGMGPTGSRIRIVSES